MTDDPQLGSRDARREELMAEAQAAIAYSANSLRSIRERYREAHLEQVGRWDRLRDELADADRALEDVGPAFEATPAVVGPREPVGEPSRATNPEPASGRAPATNPGPATIAGVVSERRTATNPGSATNPGAATAEVAAEAGAADARLRALRRDEAIAARVAGAEAAELARLDLALKSLESVWLFLSHNDASLVSDPTQPMTASDIQMRIVEAQEAERTRLAREVHDGPAQALSNATFQLEVVERNLARDPVLAAAELRLLRDLLRRELGDVRAFIGQLRPPILADLGLGGAVRDAAGQLSASIGIPVGVDLDDSIERLPEPAQTVVLRIIQEALQNVRRHSQASDVTIAAGRDDGEAAGDGDEAAAGPGAVTEPRAATESRRNGGAGWFIEVRDDGRGFDVGAVAARGRRNYGLQFMRERAELIGARFEVRSRPDGGTVVRIAIPRGAEETR